MEKREKSSDDIESKRECFALEKEENRTRCAYALNRCPPPPPRITACKNSKNRFPYSTGSTGLILCCKGRIVPSQSPTRKRTRWKEHVLDHPSALYTRPHPTSKSSTVSRYR